MAYDDDEKNEPVGFEQDEESDDFGDGYFTYADGSRKYASDYETAKQLDKAGKAQYGAGDPEEKAEAPAIGKLAPPEDSGPQRETGESEGDDYDTKLDANEEARFQAWKHQFAPNDSGGDYDLRGAFKAGVEPDPENGHWPDTWKKPNHPTFSNESQYASRAPDKAGHWEGETYVPPGKSSPDVGVSAPVQAAQSAPPAFMTAAPPSKPLPVSGQSRSVSMQDSMNQTTTGSQSGSTSRTGSAVPREQFDAAQRSIGAAYDNAAQTADDNRFSEAAALANRAAMLEQQGRDREAAAAAAMAQREQRSSAVKQKIGETASRPTDNNKIWKDKGILGTVLGGIGVMLGGVSAYMMGRENSALKSIQEQKRLNIQSQLEDRDSELRGLERELGSLDAAIPVFEARMNEALKQRIEAGLVDEKSQSALRNGRDLMAKLDLEKTTKLAEGERAYFGTLATQQASQQGTSQSIGNQTAVTEGETRSRPAGVKGKDPREDMLKALQLDKALEQQGYTREQRGEMLGKLGYSTPTGQTSEEFDRRDKATKAADAKYTEGEGKAQAAQDTIGEFGKAAGLRRDPKTGKWAVGDGALPPGFVESINPFSSKPIESRLNAAVEAYGRLQSGGVIGDEELENFRDQLGANTSNREQLAEKLNAAEVTIRARRPKDEREKTTGVPGSWK